MYWKILWFCVTSSLYERGDPVQNELLVNMSDSHDLMSFIKAWKTMAKQIALQDCCAQTRPDEHYLAQFARDKISSKFKQFLRFKNVSSCSNISYCFISTVY